MLLFIVFLFGYLKQNHLDSIPGTICAVGNEPVESTWMFWRKAKGGF
jgi:hypothetical protein